MASVRSKQVRTGFRSALLLLIAVIYSFPILYMVFSSFKSERDIAPPSLTFRPTLENYEAVISDDLVKFAVNSITITGLATLLTLALGVPIAYVIVYGRLKKPLAHYNWYITTTLLPAVAVVFPIYLILNELRLLDSVGAMVVLYAAIGVPLMVWMSTTYFLDVPPSILEAARVDGASRWQGFWLVIMPIVRSGVISTALLVFIMTWNEFLFVVALTFTDAPTLPVFMNRFLTQQGLFWGKMSAAATIAVIIPIVLGFFAQKSLVKGLLAGAVKE